MIGKQELEVKLGRTHISFETAKIGSLVDVQSSEDPEGMRVFYYLVQDLRVGATPVRQDVALEGRQLTLDERSHPRCSSFR